MPSTVKTSTETTARDELPEPFTKDQRKEIDHLRGTGMISAVGEYTPSEFWELLDAYDALRARCEELRAENDQLRAHLELRANAQDPLTVQLRQRAEQAEAKLRECEKDAARYRVLIKLMRPGHYIQLRRYERTHEIDGETFALYDYSGKLLSFGATIDAAIDAARKQEER